EVGVQQQQNFVLVHVPECSFPWTEDGPAPCAPLRVGRRDGRGEKRRQCSIGAVGRVVAFLLIGFAVALYLRSRRAGADTPEYSPAEELRTKLAEARAGEDEPEAEPGLEH